MSLCELSTARWNRTEPKFNLQEDKDNSEEVILCIPDDFILLQVLPEIPQSHLDSTQQPFLFTFFSHFEINFVPQQE